MTEDNASDADYIRLLQADMERQGREAQDINRDLMFQFEYVLVDKFRVLREERGWSQTDLCSRLSRWGFDFHQTTIAKLEAHKRPMRVAEMFAFAHAFEMPAAAVFYMAYAIEDASYEALSKQLQLVDEEMAELRNLYLGNLESLIDVLGDRQLKRNQLADAMRRAGNTRNTDMSGSEEARAANAPIRPQRVQGVTPTAPEAQSQVGAAGPQ